MKNPIKVVKREDVAKAMDDLRKDNALRRDEEQTCHMILVSSYPPQWKSRKEKWRIAGETKVQAR